MVDRPVIFSAPMVRALLEGRKSQTRRILKPQPETRRGMGCMRILFKRGSGKPWGDVALNDDLMSAFTPYAVGQRLWVREAFRGAQGYESMGLPPIQWGNKPVWYVADGEPPTPNWWFLSDKTRPSIHMPRWASRLTLTVTDVRVERLNAISEDDARAEGIREFPALGPHREGRPFFSAYDNSGGSNEGARATAASAFQVLWEDIHGPEAWQANPWVVAVRFTAERRNIDAKEAT